MPFPEELPVFTVSQLNAFVDEVMGQMEVSVRGEVSGFKVLQRKWASFDLKDAESRLPCFMPVFSLDTAIEDGMEVQLTGRPGVYSPYGKYTFRAQAVSPVGQGALQRAFALLQAKLEKEGLFAPEHKQPVPRFPESIGIITSRDAAAYTDVLRILNNRWGGVRIVFGHVAVQGNTAPDLIASMIAEFNQRHPVDVILLVRGGGSIEDLQAFNTETVVRAIFAAKIPIITGIGHERDVTLADLVADLRASTPSNAAELAVPERTSIALQLHQARTAFSQAAQHQVARQQQRLSTYQRRLQYAFAPLQQRLELFSLRLQHALARQQQTVSQYLQLLDQQATRFAALHPEHLLQRGYSVTTLTTGEVVRSIANVSAGTLLKTRLPDGTIHSTTREVIPAVPTEKSS